MLEIVKDSAARFARTFLLCYRLGTVNSNTVNSKFHLIRSYYEIFLYHFPNIPCLKCTVNSNFHLIRSKTLLTNDFELTVLNLYIFGQKCCFKMFSYQHMFIHLEYFFTHTIDGSQCTTVNLEAYIQCPIN